VRSQRLLSGASAGAGAEFAIKSCAVKGLQAITAAAARLAVVRQAPQMARIEVQRLFTNWKGRGGGAISLRSH
jgi:hypothetical protein